MNTEDVLFLLRKDKVSIHLQTEALRSVSPNAILQGKLGRILKYLHLKDVFSTAASSKSVVPSQEVQKNGEPSILDVVWIK